MEEYQIQLIWNREFNWSNYSSPVNNLNSAKAAAISIRDSGDGARVKKVRIVNTITDEVLWTG